MMHWGFNNQQLNQIITSTKIETLEYDTSFGNIIKFNKCIVPASYFVKVSTTMKEHYEFYTHNDELLSFAGIWQNVGSVIKPSYKVCLIDKKANNIVRTVNNRSPLMLSSQDINSWLNSNMQINYKKVSYEGLKIKLFKKRIEHHG